MFKNCVTCIPVLIQTIFSELNNKIFLKMLSNKLIVFISFSGYFSAGSVLQLGFFQISPDCCIGRWQDLSENCSSKKAWISILNTCTLKKHDTRFWIWVSFFMQHPPCMYKLQLPEDRSGVYFSTHDANILPIIVLKILLMN